MLIAVYSFGSVDPVSLDVGFGWTTANYRAFASTLYLHSLLRSVFLSVGATASCAVLGFSLAYFISRQPPRAQRLLLVAVIVPFWTSFIVRTYSWVDLLQNLGPLDRLAGDARPDRAATSAILYTPTAIAIGIVYSYLPLMILPIYVSLERIDASIYNAAADLGATPWRQFRRVVLPLAMPGVIAGSIIVGIPALGEYVIPEILGGGKTLMIGNILAEPVPEHRQLPVRLGARGHADGHPDDPALRAASQAAARGRAREHPPPPRERAARAPGARVPVAAAARRRRQLVQRGHADGGLGRLRPATGTTSRANDHDVREGLKTTLIIAFASALVSLAVGVSGALWWRRAPRRARAVYDGLVFARIIVPEVVFATALFFLFVHFQLPARAARDHHRPLGLELGLRDADHPGADGRPRPCARGGGRRSRRDAVARLPARDAASR